jgi:opacity protein-like surface antigen
MRSALLFVLLVLGVAVSATAQEHSLTFVARGGGFNALTNLNDASAPSDFKTGYNIGGAAVVQVNRYVGVRGDFTFARAKFRDAGSETNDHFNKLFYTGAIQLGYPTTSGFTPYLFAGGGGVTIKEKESPSGVNVDKTKGAGVGGIGFSYRIPQTNWSLVTEGVGYLYKVNGLSGTLAGFDKTQLDVAWTGGLSYALPF